MKLLCLPHLRRARDIVASQFLQSASHSNCTKIVPLTPIGRQVAQTQVDRDLNHYNPFYRQTRLWTTLLTGVTVLSALIFFLIQWIYQDWTARKDFLEYCLSLQDTNKTLSYSCDRALEAPLSPPPFSHGDYVRRYIADKTPLQILVLYEKNSDSQNLLFISLYLSSLITISISGFFFIYSTRFGIFRRKRWFIVKLTQHSRESGYREEEWMLGSDELKIVSKNTSNLERPTRSGRFHSNLNVSDLSAATSSGPQPYLRLSGIRNRMGSVRRQSNLGRNNKGINMVNTYTHNQEKEPPGSLRMPNTKSTWFESLNDKLNVVLPAWLQKAGKGTEAINSMRTQGDVLPVDSLFGDSIAKSLFGSPNLSINCLPEPTPLLRTHFRHLQCPSLVLEDPPCPPPTTTYHYDGSSKVLPRIYESDLTSKATKHSCIEDIANPQIGGFQCNCQDYTAQHFPIQYLLVQDMNGYSFDQYYYCLVKGCPRGQGGKHFMRKDKLLKHLLRHDSPEYACPYCVRKEHIYPRPDDIQRYIRVYHPQLNRDSLNWDEFLVRRPENSSRAWRRRMPVGLDKSIVPNETKTAGVSSSFQGVSSAMASPLMNYAFATISANETPNFGRELSRESADAGRKFI